MTSKFCRIDVDATSSRRIDVSPTLYLRHVPALYRLEAKKRNLRNLEPEASVASGRFLIAKISLHSL